MINAETALLENYLIVGALVFSIGAVGFLARRNLIVMFLSAEMMLQGVALSLVAWSRFHNNWDGQILVVFIITVAACEAAIGLALIVMLFRRSGNIDIAAWQTLREDNLEAYLDKKVPEDREEERVWPRLTPAGHEPQPDEDELSHRTRV